MREREYPTIIKADPPKHIVPYGSHLRMCHILRIVSIWHRRFIPHYPHDSPSEPLENGSITQVVSAIPVSVCQEAVDAVPETLPIVNVGKSHY